MVGVKCKIKGLLTFDAGEKKSDPERENTGMLMTPQYIYAIFFTQVYIYIYAIANVTSDHCQKQK